MMMLGGFFLLLALVMPSDEKLIKIAARQNRNPRSPYVDSVPLLLPMDNPLFGPHNSKGGLQDPIALSHDAIPTGSMGQDGASHHPLHLGGNNQEGVSIISPSHGAVGPPLGNANPATSKGELETLKEKENSALLHDGQGPMGGHENHASSGVESLTEKINPATSYGGVGPVGGLGHPGLSVGRVGPVGGLGHPGLSVGGVGPVVGLSNPSSSNGGVGPVGELGNPSSSNGGIGPVGGLGHPNSSSGGVGPLGEIGHPALSHGGVGPLLGLGHPDSSNSGVGPVRGLGHPDSSHGEVGSVGGIGNAELSDSGVGPVGGIDIPASPKGGSSMNSPPSPNGGIGPSSPNGGIGPSSPNGGIGPSSPNGGIGPAGHQQLPGLLNQPPHGAITSGHPGAQVNGLPNLNDQKSNNTPWNQLRLPTNVVPMLYTIILKPNLTHGYFEGTCSIIVQVKQPTKYILLHSKGLNYTQITVLPIAQPPAHPSARHSAQPSAHPSVQLSAQPTVQKNILFNYFMSPEYEYLVLVGNQNLEAGKMYQVNLKFHGLTLDDKLLGLYRSTYLTKDGQKKFLALTKFEPTDARLVFPCFDEPAFKAKFKMSVIHEPQYIALGNMPVVKNYRLNNGLILTEFNESVPMSTYLVAIIVSEFQYTSSRTKNGIEVRVYSRPEQIRSTVYAVDVAVKTLDFFANYYGVPYPLPKSDLVAIPDFKSGAMENWGLISFRETSLLYDPQESSIADKEKAMKTTIHELGHMWFGNLVTMKWWNDLWLNEGFARFTEQLAGDFVEPTWHLHEKFVPRVIEQVMIEDAGAQSHPIVLPVSKPKDINSMFDSITYEKGASVIYMLEAILGTNQFRNGLKNYLSFFAFKNTVTKDLWDKLTEASNPKLDVSRFMDTWTKQEGYPIVHIQHSPKTPNLILATQQRFFSMPNDSLTSKKFLWELPLTYINPTNGKMDIKWLHQSQQNEFQIPYSNQLMKFNVNNTGYYRVNYEVPVWIKFAEQLFKNYKVFTATDRANLLDDVFSLSKGGYMNYAIAFEMLKYINQEVDYVPLAAVVPHLLSLASKLEATPTYPLIRKLIIILLTPIYQKLGWNPQGSYQIICTRNLILSAMCTLGHPPCLIEASKQFQEWRARRRIIAPDLKTVVYKFGIQSSFNSDDWEYVWNSYVNHTISAQEKDKYLTALSATRVPWLIHRLISFVKDKNKIRSQDFFIVLGRLAGNPVAVDMVWNFIRSDWKSIVDRFTLNSESLGRPFTSVAPSFNAAHRLKEMEDFVQKYPDIGAGQSKRKSALDIVKRNIEWNNRCVGPIHQAVTKLLSDIKFQ